MITVEKPKEIRERLKEGILGCLKDVESNIEDILDRLMSRCCNAYIKINIEPASIITYEEHHEHFPAIEHTRIDGRKPKE